MSRSLSRVNERRVDPPIRDTYWVKSFPCVGTTLEKPPGNMPGDEEETKVDAALGENEAARIIENALYRKWKARAIVRGKIHDTYEKVYDGETGNFFVFNSKTGSSSWELPLCLKHVGHVDLLTPRSRELTVYKKEHGTWKTHEDLTEDEAARKIQGMVRSRNALRNVRAMVIAQYERCYDVDQNRYFYFNTRTQESFWEKPRILGSVDVPLTPRSQEAVNDMFRREEAIEHERLRQLEEAAFGTTMDGHNYYDESKYDDQQAAASAGAKVDDQGPPRATTADSDRPSTGIGARPMTGESTLGGSKAFDSDEDSDDEERPETAMTKYSEKNAGAILNIDDQLAVKKQQLHDFLEEEELEEYEEQLIEEGFDDMEAVLAILPEDIDAIGFQLAAKRKLLAAVEKFREDAGLDSEEDSNDDISRESLTDSDSEEDEFDAEARLQALRDGDESEDALSDDDDKPDLTGIDIVVKFKGDGENRPFFGQVVRCHYTATLEGSKKPFEDSRERGRAFEFKLGASQVCPGWENAIRTMSFGQRSVCTMSPDVCYGERGHPPVIPPGATIIFDIQFIRSYYANADEAYEHQGLVGESMIGTGGKEAQAGGVYKALEGKAIDL